MAFKLYCHPDNEDVARPVAEQHGLDLVVDPDCRREHFYVTDPDKVVMARVVDL